MRRPSTRVHWKPQAHLWLFHRYLAVLNIPSLCRGERSVTESIPQMHASNYHHATKWGEGEMMNGKEKVKKEEEHEGTLQINETRGAFKFRLNYCLFSKWQEEASVPHLSAWSYEVFYSSH